MEQTRSIFKSRLAAFQSSLQKLTNMLSADIRVKRKAVGGCNWVPAAHSTQSLTPQARHLIYGGVLLAPRVVKTGRIRLPSGTERFSLNGRHTSLRNPVAAINRQSQGGMRPRTFHVPGRIILPRSSLGQGAPAAGGGSHGGGGGGSGRSGGGGSGRGGGGSGRGGGGGGGDGGDGDGGGGDGGSGGGRKGQRKARPPSERKLLAVFDKHNPGLLQRKDVASFTDGEYKMTLTSGPRFTCLHRAYGGPAGETGRFWMIGPKAAHRKYALRILHSGELQYHGEAHFTDDPAWNNTV